LEATQRTENKKSQDKTIQGTTEQNGEIRASEIFKTGALNHSATLPATASQALGVGTDKNKLRIGPKFSSFGMLGWAATT